MLYFYTWRRRRKENNNNTTQDYRYLDDPIPIKRERKEICHLLIYSFL
jgi:hypothetical protein